MRMRSSERLAKQFLSEYDIASPSTFYPHTDERKRQN